MPRITLLFAALHAVLVVVLAARVAMLRYNAKIALGDGGDKVMTRRVRAHGNLSENAPLALLLLGLLELSGLDPRWLWGFGGTLLLGRLLHAYGLSRRSGTSPGRFLGMALTWAVLLGEAGVAIRMFATGA
ncbi:MAG: MAPEG family protein [Lysobacteraceae bacterium]